MLNSTSIKPVNRIILSTSGVIIETQKEGGEEIAVKEEWLPKEEICPAVLRVLRHQTSAMLDKLERKEVIH